MACLPCVVLAVCTTGACAATGAPGCLTATATGRRKSREASNLERLRAATSPTPDEAAEAALRRFGHLALAGARATHASAASQLALRLVSSDALPLDYPRAWAAAVKAQLGTSGIAVRLPSWKDRLGAFSCFSPQTGDDGGGGGGSGDGDSKGLVAAAFYGIGASCLAASDIAASASAVVTRLLDKPPDERGVVASSLSLIADAVLKEHARATAQLQKEAKAAETAAAAARGRLASGLSGKVALLAEPVPATPMAKEGEVPAASHDEEEKPAGFVASD